jgi:hypothetical protein
MTMKLKEMDPEEYWPCFRAEAKHVHPFSIVGRILDDQGGPVRHGVEWQQPYFVEHGGAGYGEFKEEG